MEGLLLEGVGGMIEGMGGMIEEVILVIFMGYMLGSIPTGYIVGKWVKGMDIREHGSGNVGATNVMREVGRLWGILVLLLDGLKGMVVVLLIGLWGIEEEWLYLMGGVVAFLGHIYPVWLRFRGGKGVAVGMGVFLSLRWIEMLITVGVFGVVVWFKRYVSLGSVVGGLIFPVLIFMDIGGNGDVLLYGLVASGIGLLIVIKHYENLKRMKEGRERKVELWRKK